MPRQRRQWPIAARRLLAAGLLLAVGSAPLSAAAFNFPEGSGLDFLECEGPGFHPAWGDFKRELRAALGGRDLGSGLRLGERLASQAADLLDWFEGRTQEDLAIGVGAFGARLRGDDAGAIEADGFCLYGAITAYAALALHLDDGPDSPGLPPTAKSSAVRALLLLAKKQTSDFLESSSWPVRSLELVAMLEGEDSEQIRALPTAFRLPCHLRLGCRQAMLRAEAAVAPPPTPVSASWPAEVAAIGIHTTSTLEVVTALRDAVAEAWGRGGPGSQSFQVRYAGHPCPTHTATKHQCRMRCELLGQCDEAEDPLADFIASFVDIAKVRDKGAYTLAEARETLQSLQPRLGPIVGADLMLCTYPTVLCLLLHELFPERPMLFVAIANPLFAAPGCERREDNTVMDCDSEEATEYLGALRRMLQNPSGLVRGVSACTVTAALVGYQTGVAIPVTGKAGRYLPAGAIWSPEREAEVLVARSRFMETQFGASLRALTGEFAERFGLPLRCLLQQELGGFLSYEELAKFRAVVIFAQDLALLKFTEHYAMGMPIWMPSRPWAYRLQMLIPWGMVSYSGSWRGPTAPAEGAPPGHPARLLPPGEDWPAPGSFALAHAPFFNAQTVPYPLADAAYWYEFSEFAPYPGVQSFDSVPELLVGLATADLFAISGTMRRFRAELWRSTRAVYAAACSELAAAVAAAEGEPGGARE